MKQVYINFDPLPSIVRNIESDIFSDCLQVIEYGV